MCLQQARLYRKTAVLKEANETNYWLELLLKTNYIDEANYQELNNSCAQIRVMLIKSINTAKGDEK